MSFRKTSPTLRIRFTTPFATITDPALYHTLPDCEGLIAWRHHDFSTSVDVTVTNTVTGEVVLARHYAKYQPPIDIEELLYMPLDPLTYENVPQERYIYPLLAEPGNPVVCLSDGAAGTIVAIEDLAGQLAYRVQLTDGTLRHVLATDLDSPPVT
jgi:hypothetical protein